MPKSFGITPIDQAAHDAAEPGPYFRVLHEGVGAHPKSNIVRAKEFGRGVDIDRLVRLGAVAPLTEDEIEAHERALEEAATVVTFDQRFDPRFSTGSTAPAPIGMPPEHLRVEATHLQPAHPAAQDARRQQVENAAKAQREAAERQAERQTAERQQAERQQPERQAVTQSPRPPADQPPPTVGSQTAGDRGGKGK